MNRLPFGDIVKGTYGRRVAMTDAEQITADNVVSVVGECMGVHHRNIVAIKYLWAYYKGDAPARYRKKVVRSDIVNTVIENHAYEIVQFKTGQTYGEPVQYISLRDDDASNEAVDRLNGYMNEAEKQAKDVRSGEWQSAVGTSFKAIQRAQGRDLPFRIVVPSPINTFVIYNRSTEEPMLSVQELKNEAGEVYRLCFSDTHQYTLINGQVTDVRLHAFGGIPIIEYPNNPERLSDIELVIDLLDAINSMQSNRMDAVEQFVQSWIKFINCEIDAESFESMKKMGALVVQSNNGDTNKADVDIMTQELNQTESQVAKDDLWDNAMSILAIPNKEGNTGGDTQGAVELRNGWDFSKNRAKLKDPFVKAGDKRLAKLALEVLRQAGKGLDLVGADFEAQILHSPLDNFYTKTQALTQLLQAGISPQVAVATCGLWGDAEKTYILSKPYLDNLYQTKDAAADEKEAEAALMAAEAEKIEGSEPESDKNGKGAEGAANDDTA